MTTAYGLTGNEDKRLAEAIVQVLTSQARIMLQHGEDNEYIKLLTNLTDKEIEALRQDEQ